MLRSQAGSAMIYIFIAIALLAGLLYAMNQESRVNTSALTEERANLLASEIIERSNAYGMSVQKLLLRGCDETEISFENSLHPAAATHANGNSPTDNSCHVFHPSGGGIALESISLPEDTLDTAWTAESHYGYIIFTNNTCVDGIGTGPPCTVPGRELLVWTSFIKESVCEAINTRLAIGSIGGEDTSASPFRGDFSNGSAKLIDVATVANKPAGCIEDNAGPTLGAYVYFSTLKAR